VINYGGGQDFRRPYRQAIFKGGLGSPDRAYGDVASPPFKYLQELIAERSANGLCTHVRLEIVQESDRAAGVFACGVRFEVESAIIVPNASDYPVLAAKTAAELSPLARLVSGDSLCGRKSEIAPDPEGAASMVLAPGGGVVFFSRDLVENADGSAITAIEVDPLFTDILIGEAMQMSGTASGVEEVRLLVDGVLSA